MENEKEILKEIKQLKEVVSKLIGSSELPAKNRFSIEAIEKASKEFQRLNIARDQWIDAEKLSKYIKGASWQSGNFIIKAFEFTNYIKRGHQIFYNKEDIIALGKELKSRNVDLGRYISLCNDKESFQKKVEATRLKEAEKAKKKPFKIPKDAKEIITSSPPKPSVEEVRADLKKLKDEFFEGKYSEYLDIYGGNYSMFKELYMYKRWIDPAILKKLTKWRDSFNHINSVLQELTKKKEVFIPVPEKDMIRL